MRKYKINFIFAFLAITLIAPFRLSAAPKKILMILPGGSMVNPEVKRIVADLKAAGHEIEIRTPPARSVNWKLWTELQIFDDYKGPLDRNPPASKDYDGAVFIGGPAMRKPKGTTELFEGPDELSIYTNSREIEALGQEFLDSNKPLAIGSFAGAFSFFYGKKVTGPGKKLDLRRSIKAWIHGGASASEIAIKKVLKTPDDYIPGPNRFLWVPWLKINSGTVVQDLNLFTAASARDFKKLTEDFNQALENPDKMQFKKHFVYYPEGEKEIGVKVVEFYPKKPKDLPDTYIEYIRSGDPMMDPEVLSKIRDAEALGYRLVIWTRPPSDQNHGKINQWKLWSNTEVSKLRTYIEEKTFPKGIPNRIKLTREERRPTFSKTPIAFCIYFLSHMNR
ncbi:MAG: hypothetical protein JWQ35_2791 [Bacteriovoracaceae bacterium]|nr:hypothetical protein [Bacteriovoracaceae bacterium]